VSSAWPTSIRSSLNPGFVQLAAVVIVPTLHVAMVHSLLQACCDIDRSFSCRGHLIKSRMLVPAVQECAQGPMICSWSWCWSILFTCACGCVPLPMSVVVCRLVVQQLPSSANSRLLLLICSALVDVLACSSSVTIEWSCTCAAWCTCRGKLARHLALEVALPVCPLATFNSNERGHSCLTLWRQCIVVYWSSCVYKS
jgi:hypothetical protein